MPEAPEPLLRLRGIAVGGDGRSSVGGVDLELFPGSAFALVGPGGARAGRVLRVAAGLRAPGAGEREAAPVPAAYVFEDGGLVTNVTVRDNVRVPLLYRGLSVADADRRADASLARFGLGGVTHLRPSALGAEGRRLAQFARAEAMDARLVYLEHPLQGLSPVGARVVEDWIDERLAEGAAVLVTETDPTTPDGEIGVRPWRRRRGERR